MWREPFSGKNGTVKYINKKGSLNMWEKKNDHKKKYTQLDLPFESNTRHKPSVTTANNVIDFSSRLQSSFEKEEREIRRKSAEYLLNYAAKLDW